MRVILTDPTMPDPTGSVIPPGLFNGPYGYLVAIAFFLFLAARELRRFREIDVASYRTEVDGLKADVAQLRQEVAGSRQASIDGAREAAVREEGYIREVSGLRAICAEHGLDTSGVVSAIAPPAATPTVTVNATVAVEQ